uniref:divalent-cation tolerance protein CutA n=1 Tax=Polynucleobacter sp. TaxID=2029855 RepID=UPI0040475523
MTGFQMQIAMTSFAELADAKAMARRLVENRLAACVQIHEGIYSIYRWKGEICEGNEVILAAKTNAMQWPAISAFIKKYHPYDLPEIIAISPIEYDVQYGDWIKSEVNL